MSPSFARVSLLLLLLILLQKGALQKAGLEKVFRKLVFCFCFFCLIKRLFSRNLNQYQGFSSFAYINHLWLSDSLPCLSLCCCCFLKVCLQSAELFIECSANASPQPCQISPALEIEEYNLLWCPCAWVIAVLTFEAQCSFFYCLLGCAMTCSFLQWCRLKKYKVQH